jgi:hypothetical protein
MVDEMDALDDNESWDIVEFPNRINVIGKKWVFMQKLNAEREVEKYKARLVEKGYSHIDGVDFGEFFSHVSKLTSIIFILSIVANFYFEIE